METIDLMDPRRRRQHSLRLGLGYLLIAVALVLATTVLLFVAYGFGLKNGRLVQNGLIFLSSSPGSAQIYVNGTRYRDTSNTKLVLPEGNYTVTLKRPDYRDWQRQIGVRGGLVESLTYPLLFPRNLTTKTLASYPAAPVFISQTPDRRWLIVAQPASLTSFELYDMNNPSQSVAHLTLPDTLEVRGASAVQPVAWADDNHHLLLRYTTSTAPIYVMIDVQSIDQSRNLTSLLSLPADTTLGLINNKFDRYYLWNAASHELQTSRLDDTAPKQYLTNVLTYAAEGDHDVLYATPDALDAQKTTIALYDGNSHYVVHRAAASQTYLLALARHGTDQYAAMYSSSETQAFIYQNPLNQLSNEQRGVAIPAQVLRTVGAQTLSVAPGGQYLAFCNGVTLAVYDVVNAAVARLQLSGTLASGTQAPQWLDPAHLSYVNGGQLTVCDYDGQNCQALITADGRFRVGLDQSLKTLLAIVPAVNGGSLLVSTSLRTAADQ